MIGGGCEGGRAGGNKETRTEGKKKGRKRREGTEISSFKMFNL